MLDQSPSTFAPPSTHLLAVFSHVIETYGDLTDETNRRALLLDGQELIRLNVLQWSLGPPRLAELVDRRVTSAIDLLFLAYDLAADLSGATSWVCKSLENLDYIDDLGRADPDLAFIHLVRDGRDVALSLRQAPIGPKDPYIQAREWARHQRKISEFRRRYYDRVVLVRYEELVSNPSIVVGRLHERLGFGQIGRVERFFESEMAKRTVGLSDLWTNLSRPVIAANFGAHRDPGNAAHVSAFERVAGEVLEQFGYEPLFDNSGEHEVDWAQAERNDLQLRRQRSSANDRSTERLHAGYDQFVKRLLSRSLSQAGSPTASQ